MPIHLHEFAYPFPLYYEDFDLKFNDTLCAPSS